jgi:hypothetical protein
MGKVAGVCTICERASVDVYRCVVCSSTVCSRCFMPDINVCKRCLRRGLWVSDRDAE